MLLLKYFWHGGKAENLRKEQWDPVLPDGLQGTLKWFIANGVLVSADLAQTAHATFNAAKAKELARQRGLKLSGNRPVVIDRLLQADPEGMRVLLANEKVLICAPDVIPTVTAFVEKGYRTRDDLEADLFRMLKEHQFKEAVQKVSQFESSQVFGRGLGVDWSKGQSELLERVESIFRARPKILKGLDETEREPLCVAAAMMELLGTNTAKKWLPDGMKGVPKFDLDTAARMQLFGSSKRLVVSEPGLNYEIIGAEDSCEACRKLAGKVMTAKNVPELPYEHCTHEYGCRCEAIPKLN